MQGRVGVTYELYGARKIQELFKETRSVVVSDLEGKWIGIYICGSFVRGIGMNDRIRHMNDIGQKNICEVTTNVF